MSTTTPAPLPHPSVLIPLVRSIIFSDAHLQNMINEFSSPDAGSISLDRTNDVIGELCLEAEFVASIYDDAIRFLGPDYRQELGFRKRVWGYVEGLRDKMIVLNALVAGVMQWQAYGRP